MKRISEELSKVIRYERSFGVAVIDIDKECLKKYGFLKDEIYLKLTAQLVCREFAEIALWCNIKCYSF